MIATIRRKSKSTEDKPVPRPAPELIDMKNGSRTASSVVADGIRSEILHQKLKGGDRLRQDAWAVRFGVSQMVVREAFKQLVSEGFLRNEPRRGVSVASMNANEAWEMTQLRSLIECQALRWAMPNITLIDIGRIEKILLQLDKSKTVDKRIALNAEFHELLYLPCHKERTLNLIAMLRVNFERYLRFTWEETHHFEQSQKEHYEILENVRKGNTEKATDLLREHILGTGHLLVGSLENNPRL